MVVHRSPYMWCPDCEGRGVLTEADGSHATCPRCGGQGRLKVSEAGTRAASPLRQSPPVAAPGEAVPPASAEAAPQTSIGDRADTPGATAGTEGSAAPAKIAAAARTGAPAPVPPQAIAGDTDTWLLGVARLAAGHVPGGSGAVLADAAGTLRLGLPFGRDVLGAGSAVETLVASAARLGIATAGLTLYLTHAPDGAQARLIITAGIARVVLDGPVDSVPETVRRQFLEAGVALRG
ncbi:hypothetical protein ACLBXM_08335 [Xanthobacteraceae bacterium A53D]